MGANGRISCLQMGFLTIGLMALTKAKQYKGNECNGNAPGRYSQRADCSSYITCFTNSTFVVSTCPAGKKFHARLQTCEPEKTVDCSKHYYSSMANQMEVYLPYNSERSQQGNHTRKKRRATIRIPTGPFGVFEDGVYVPYLVWKGSELTNCEDPSKRRGNISGRGFFFRRKSPSTTPPPGDDEVIEDSEERTPDVYVNMGTGGGAGVGKQEIKKKKVHFMTDDEGHGANQEMVIGKKVVGKENFQAWTQKPNEAFTLKPNDTVAETGVEHEPWAYYAPE